MIAIRANTFCFFADGGGGIWGAIWPAGRVGVGKIGWEGVLEPM